MFMFVHALSFIRTSKMRSQAGIDFIFLLFKTIDPLFSRPKSEPSVLIKFVLIKENPRVIYITIL